MVKIRKYLDCLKSLRGFKRGDIKPDNLKAAVKNRDYKADIECFLNWVESLSPAKAAFMVIVVMPTIISAFYYLIWASDIYISEAKFSVHVEGEQNAATGLASFISSAGIESRKDILLVNEYINSSAVLDELQKNINIRNIYSSWSGDFFSRASYNEDKEDFFEYFQKMNDVKIDQDSGVITLRARAFSADDAQKISSETLKLTELFLNTILGRIRNDSVDFAKKQLAEAEEGIINIMNQINDFRKNNKDFDPANASSGVLGIIQSLEAEKAKTNAELEAESKVMSENSFKLQDLRKKVASFDVEIDSQKQKLIGNGQVIAGIKVDGALADKTNEYSRLLMQQEFATKRYELALTALESAQTLSARKNKYITRVLEPTLPDTAVEPERLFKILTVFVVMLLIYAVGGLVISGIRDHVINYD